MTLSSMAPAGWTLTRLSLLLLAAGAAAAGGCTPSRSATERPVAASAPDPFVDVTEPSGIRWTNIPAKRPMRLLESVGFGGGFVDFDQDGYPDVFLAGAPRCGLFRNQRDGTFTEVTAKAGLDAPGDWIGFAAGDYDNDGYPDLFVTGYRKCALYRNWGDGTFRDVTRQAGVDVPGKWNTAATFADFDRDGRLDLYVGAYCKFGPESRQYCVLHDNGVKTGCRPIDYDPEIGNAFRNRGDGTFEDVTRAWGMDRAHGRTLGAVVADYNADGWPDLYLANDEMPADLFRNEKGRRFTNVAAVTGAAYREGGQLMGGMGADWGDYDNDGWLDLAVGTFESEEKSLFHSLSGQSFEFASGQAGILTATYPDVVFGTLLFDYDNDGRLDLLFVNGHTMDNIAQIRPTIPYRQPARLFHNRGGGAFDLASTPSLEVPIAGRAAACADCQNDGQLALLVVDMDGKVRLLKNRAGAGSHWLEVALRGTRSNRDGLGARVLLKLGDERRLAEAVTSRSYLSACDARVHFGLGSSTRVDELEIRWPSGAVTRRKDVPVDQILQVTEGK